MKKDPPDHRSGQTSFLYQWFWTWGPLLLWSGLIFYLSSIPHLKSTFDPLWDLILRKIAHVSEYAILAGLWTRATRKRVNPWPIKQTAFTTVLFCLIYALFDEFHQSFIPGRVASPLDVLLDSFGAISFTILWIKYKLCIVSNRS